MTAAWLAWRDVVVRPGRTLLAILVVAACAAVYTFAELEESSRDAAVSTELDAIAVPLRVVAARTPGAGQSFLDLSAAARVRAAAGDGVQAVEPWLSFETKVGGLDARLVGAPPGSRRAAAIPTGGIALGAVLAQRLGVTTGAQVAVADQLRPASVLSPVGDGEDTAAFVSLEAAQAILGVKDAVSELRVRLWPTARVSDVQARVRERLPGVVTLRVERGAVADVSIGSSLRAHHLGVAIATAVAALLCLAIAAWLDTAERRLELAGLVALGATPRHVLVAVASRSGLLAGLGGATGAVVGALAASVAGELKLIGTVAPVVVAMTIAGAGLLGILGSVPPALVAIRHDPARDLQEAAT